ncbi:MAG TPA: hypothetical protein VLJ39_19585 [Tepidisphaeraceae bacterium]|nr:hypothetical protein [Tepidisphaeraceae bacterium]
MASILEGQIDFLGQQVDALDAEDRTADRIQEALSVSLVLFEQLPPADATSVSPSLFEHWLRSAEILPTVRELKRAGIAPARMHEFMRALLRARAVVHPANASTDSRRHSLDEVERELQRRTE